MQMGRRPSLYGIAVLPCFGCPYPRAAADDPRDRWAGRGGAGGDCARPRVALGPSTRRARPLATFPRVGEGRRGARRAASFRRRSPSGRRRQRAISAVRRPFRPSASARARRRDASAELPTGLRPRRARSPRDSQGSRLLVRHRLCEPRGRPRRGTARCLRSLATCQHSRRRCPPLCDVLV
jgi:hypothetical protein